VQITILYFGIVRYTLGKGSERLKLPSQITTLAALKKWLVTKNSLYLEAFGSAHKIQMAVNGKITTDSTLSNGDEVAFFPPASGG